MNKPQQTLSKLAVAGLATMALSGCVIVASEGGESTTRFMTIEQAQSEPNLAMVRRFSADGAVVQMTLWSNCENVDSFEVELTQQAHIQALTVRARDSARCEGEMREQALQWTYETLALTAGDHIIVRNALVM